MNARELSRAIERCETIGAKACVEATRRLRPDFNAEAIEIAGGIVAFAGVDSPFSQAVGLGLEAPVSAAEVEQVTEFYAQRGSTPSVLANPTADPSLAGRLAAAGYQPVEFENALAAELAAIGGKRDERIVASDDPMRWGEYSARAFMGVDELPPGASLVGEVIASAAGVLVLEGIDDGCVAATGAMDVQGEVAGLFASSTLPPYRRRGWQTALILDRIARARAAGARYARAAAAVGSTSEANFRRCGFSVLYTRTLWQRK